MKIVTWNVKGAGNARFRLNVQDLINAYSPENLVILEPKISGNHAEHVIGQVGLPRHFCVDPIGLSGGLWVLWDDCRCNVDVVQATDQSVAMLIRVPSLPFPCTRPTLPSQKYVEEVVRWIPALIPHITINTDDSSRGNLGPSGVGGLARSASGSWLWGFLLRLGFTNNTMAELWGIRSALLLAWNRGYRGVTFQTDSLLETKWLTTNIEVPVEFSNLVFDCMLLLNRGNAAPDLTTATKRAEDHTKRWQDVEGHLRTTKEDTAVLKKKLAEAVSARGIAEYTGDEAMRAKDEAVFVRIYAERSAGQAEEEAFAEGVAKTEAILKAQIPFHNLRVDRPFRGAQPRRALEGARTEGQEAPQEEVRLPTSSPATLTVPPINPTVEGPSEVAPPRQGLSSRTMQYLGSVKYPGIAEWGLSSNRFTGDGSSSGRTINSTVLWAGVVRTMILPVALASPSIQVPIFFICEASLGRSLSALDASVGVRTHRPKALPPRPRAVVTAAPTRLPARQSLGVTLIVPCAVARRDIPEVPNAPPRGTPLLEETRKITSRLVPECCRLQRPTLVRIRENQGNIMGEGFPVPLRRLLSLFQLRRTGQGVVGSLEAC
nr:putative ribonuclease h protein [Quercus suber]